MAADYVSVLAVGAISGEMRKPHSIDTENASNAELGHGSLLKSYR